MRNFLLFSYVFLVCMLCSFFGLFPPLMKYAFRCHAISFHSPHAWAAIWIHSFCYNVLWGDFLMSHCESQFLSPSKLKWNSWIFYVLFTFLSLRELHKGDGQVVKANLKQCKIFVKIPGFFLSLQIMLNAQSKVHSMSLGSTIHVGRMVCLTQCIDLSSATTFKVY